jgi:hypothetical protein
VTPAADPYRTLGVEPSVTDAAVHSAYRRLSKSTHPDRNGGSAEATRRFMEVQAAYEQVLAQRRQTRLPLRRGLRPAIPRLRRVWLTSSVRSEKLGRHATGRRRRRGRGA